MLCGINDFKISLKCVSCEINGRSRGNGGTFFTDFSEVSCAEALLSNLANFFFLLPPPRSSEFLLQFPYQHFPLFFRTLSFVSLRHLAPRVESTHQHPFYFRTLYACSSKKKEKKKSLATSVNRLGRHVKEPHSCVCLQYVSR